MTVSEMKMILNSVYGKSIELFERLDMSFSFDDITECLRSITMKYSLNDDEVSCLFKAVEIIGAYEHMTYFIHGAKDEIRSDAE